MCLKYCAKSNDLYFVSYHCPINRRLSSLNHALYRGLPVLSKSGNGVAFNTGLLAQNGRVPGGMVAPQSMQMGHVVGAVGASPTMQPVPAQHAPVAGNFVPSKDQQQQQQASAPVQYAAVQVVEATPVYDNNKA